MAKKFVLFLNSKIPLQRLEEENGHLQLEIQARDDLIRVTIKCLFCFPFVHTVSPSQSVSQSVSL